MDRADPGGATHRRLRRGLWLAAAALLLVFCATYAALRAQHTLVRTGQLHNVRDATGALAPGGGWMNSGVRAGDDVPAARCLELVFWPLIQVESVFWDTIGRRLGTATGP